MALYITNEEELRRHYQTLSDRASSITDYLGILEYRWPTPISYFRGEPEAYDRPCLPSIWRGEWEEGDADPPVGAEVWTKREQERGQVSQARLG